MLSSLLDSMTEAQEQAAAGASNCTASMMEPPRKRARLPTNIRGTNDSVLTFPRDDLTPFQGPMVAYSKPVHFAGVSRNSDGKWLSGASELVKYVNPKPNADLNRHYAEWKHEELGRAELTFEPVMKTVQEFVRNGGKKPRVNFVSWRGSLTKLLCAPYSGKEDWELSVYCRNDIVYFESRETKACQQRKVTMDPKSRRFTYYGYKFENYCTGMDDLPVDTQPGAIYNTICRVGIGKLRLLVCGETDCYSGDIETFQDNFLELKTSKLFAGSDRARQSFEKFKLMKYWAQSFTVGVPRIVVGFRDEAGIVRKVQRFWTMKIPNLVAGRAEEEGMWDHKVCVNFMHKLLLWIYKNVKGTKEPWLLRYAGFDSADLTLTQSVPRKAHCVFDEKLYSCVEAYPAP